MDRSDGSVREAGSKYALLVVVSAAVACSTGCRNVGARGRERITDVAMTVAGDVWVVTRHAETDAARMLLIPMDAGLKPVTVIASLHGWAITDLSASPARRKACVLSRNA